uniref:non-specific serine/threonine protein kinase n=1 Tax=Noccaea caerulescens TaxID=107243 RepID=A0A1J3JBQ2_NOCCA
MINLSLSLTKSWSYIIIWGLFVIRSCVLSADEQVDKRHKDCAFPFSCGNQLLSYPFWTSERKECGHPDFKVNCSGDFPEFNISSVKFQILQMNYSGIIKLARKDYLSNLCSQYPESARIIQDILPILEDTELLTFYYDCPDPMENGHSNDYIRQLNCEDGNGRPSYFAPPPSNSRERAVLRNFNAECKTKFNIPVSQSALRKVERNQSLEAMKEALDEGFELRCNNECSQCAKSLGACGFNESSKRFVCYCINKPHEHTCHSGKKSHDFSCSLSLNISANLIC